MHGVSWGSSGGARQTRGMSFSRQANGVSTGFVQRRVNHRCVIRVRALLGMEWRFGRFDPVGPACVSWMTIVCAPMTVIHRLDACRSKVFSPMGRPCGPPLPVLQEWDAEGSKSLEPVTCGWRDNPDHQHDGGARAFALPQWSST